MSKATVKVKTTDLSHEDWLAARRGGIGGSDAPVIMGVNPWKSPMDLWLEKTGDFADEPGETAKERMYWGQVLEDVVAQEFSRRTGKKTRRRNAILIHPRHDWMLANVDRLVVGEKAGLECKTTSAYYQDDGVLPLLYYAQVQHYMAVTALRTWYVAILAGGQRYFCYEVPRNDEYINALIEAEQYFWQLIQDGTHPEMDGSEASGRVLDRLYPRGSGEIDLPPDAFGLVQQYDEAAEEEKAAKMRKDEAANRLKAMLGEHERASVYDRKVSWTNVETSRLDTKRLKEDEPEMWCRYAKTSNYRRFAVK